MRSERWNLIFSSLKDFVSHVKTSESIVVKLWKIKFFMYINTQNVAIKLDLAFCHFSQRPCYKRKTFSRFKSAVLKVFFKHFPAPEVELFVNPSKSIFLFFYYFSAKLFSFLSEFFRTATFDNRSKWKIKFMASWHTWERLSLTWKMFKSSVWGTTLTTS